MSNAVIILKWAPVMSSEFCSSDMSDVVIVVKWVRCCHCREGSFNDISDAIIVLDLFIITTLSITGLILGLRPANERRRYFVKASLIGWVQA